MRVDMSLAPRWGMTLDSVRSSWTGPLTSRSPELARLWAGEGSSTGVPVNEQTALNYSAFWAAVSLISSDVASLPLILYKREQGGGKTRLNRLRLYKLLHDEPNPEMSSTVMRETLQAHALTWGNGYAEIERDGAGRPVNIWPLTPDRMTAFRDQRNRLMYRYLNNAGPETIFDPADVLHIPGLGFDGVTGYSVVAKARESIGLGLATERFGATFFGNGSTFGGVLEHPGTLTDKSQKNLTEALAGRHQGVDRAHKFIVLEEGMKYQRLGIPPEDAQFLETRKFQIEEMARWFGVPQHKIGAMEHSTFSNIEHQELEYYKSCLRRWLVRWEQEINRKLIAPLERTIQFAEHSLEGFLRGDSAARSEFYGKMFNIGAFSINMILEKENENGIGTPGDVHLVPMNMSPVERVNEIVDAQIKSKDKPAQVEPKADPAMGLAIELLHEQFRQAVSVAEAHLERAIAAETKAISLESAVTTTHEERSAVIAERDEARRQFQAAQSLADSLKAQIVLTEQDAERKAAELTQAGDRQSEIAAEEQRQAEARIAEAMAAADVLRQERDRAAADAALAADALSAAMAQLSEAQTKAQAEALADHASRELIALSQRDTAERITALETALAAQRADVERVESERVALLALVETTATEAREVTIAREATEAHLLEVQAKASDLERQIAAVQAEAERAAQVAADAGARVVETEQRAAVTVKEQTEAFVSAQRLKEQERLSSMLLAHRALMVDVMGRMVRRETEKARRHQATTQKLRAWMETFYPMHEDTCVEALAPVMRAHLAWMQVDASPDSEALALVRVYITDSKRQLMALLDSQPDEWNAALEKLLQRWEQKRPEAVADRMMEEGVAYVREYR